MQSQDTFELMKCVIFFKVDVTEYIYSSVLYVLRGQKYLSALLVFRWQRSVCVCGRGGGGH